MSEPTGFEHHGEGSSATEPVTPVAQPDGSGSGDNPAWSGFLETIPSGLHDNVKKHLREWDAGVNERFSKVHAEYEPYKAFDWAIQNKIDPQELQNAYGFFRQASDNPRWVYDQIGQAHGFNVPTPAQGQQVNPQQVGNIDDFDAETSPFDIENHPAFVQMRQQNEQLMQQFNQRAEQEAQQQSQAEADKWVTETNTRLSEKYPAVDMNRVWAQAAGVFNSDPNQDINAIVENIAAGEQSFIDSIRSTPPAGASAPTVLSPSGGIPVAKPISQMSDSEQRAAAVEFLTKARS